MSAASIARRTRAAAPTLRRAISPFALPLDLLHIRFSSLARYDCSTLHVTEGQRAATSGVGMSESVPAVASHESLTVAPRCHCATVTAAPPRLVYRAGSRWSIASHRHNANADARPVVASALVGQTTAATASFTRTAAAAAAAAATGTTTATANASQRTAASSAFPLVAFAAAAAPSSTGTVGAASASAPSSISSASSSAASSAGSAPVPDRMTPELIDLLASGGFPTRAGRAGPGSGSGGDAAAAAADATSAFYWDSMAPALKLIEQALVKQSFFE